MYPVHVVRRAFKAGGKQYLPGELVEDVTIVPLFKSRIQDRHMVPIPEDEIGLQNLHDYCQAKFDVDLHAALADRASKGSEIAEPLKAVVNAPTTPGTVFTEGVAPLKDAPAPAVSFPEQPKAPVPVAPVVKPASTPEK